MGVLFPKSRINENGGNVVLMLLARVYAEKFEVHLSYLGILVQL